MVDIKREILEQLEQKGLDNPPALVEDIQEAEKELGKKLPDSYKSFLSIHNGGVINTEKNWLQLAKVQEIAPRTRGCGILRLGDFIVFGTDGGEEILAFDYRDNKCSIVIFPSDYIERIKEIASSFEDFINSSLNKDFLGIND